jgi:hypothetical protein
MIPEQRVINGQPAQSMQEWFIANALWKYKHTFIYQYLIGEIGGVKGAYAVDFLVTSTAPLSTPIEYFGKHWHEGQLGADDRFRIIQINDHFGGQANDVVVLQNINTQEDANQKILATIGRG